MQHLQTHTHRGGGRIASSRYRESLQLCDDFKGLEEDTNRYSLLLLVKRVGKLARFTPRMIQLLDYYMAFTTELDWEEGSRPIVFQSLSRTALDLGVTERQIQKLEKQLFELGAITWNDSGNHKRYGQRDRETGRILYAYGVDLTPLAFMKPALEDALHKKQLYAQAWQETKREISWYRRQIRSLILEWQWEEGSHAGQYQDSYQEIAYQLRTHIELSELRSLLERHKRLQKSLLGAVGDRKGKGAVVAEIAQESSCRSEPEFTHYKYTNLNKNICSSLNSGFQKSVVEPPEPDDLIALSGLQHISLKQVLLAASDQFRERLSLEPRPMNWNDVVEAAYSLRSDLHISQQSWGEACELLGRVGAAVCLLITDQAALRTVNRVTQPAAYFRGLCNKARGGELRLHSSVFGLLKESC